MTQCVLITKMSGNIGKLSGVVFRVEDVKKISEFYSEILGMSVEENNICRYPGDGAQIKLIQTRSSSKASEANKKKSVYWKIGLSLPDVDLARSKILQFGGIEVSTPTQFRDIGYLCHLADPEGRSIELLQHSFASNFVKPVENPEMALGQDSLIGQITLRCSDISKSLQLYR